MKNGLKIMAFAMMLMTVPIAVVSCDNEDKPDSPSEQDSAVVGKWQKYARVDDDGSLSGGDPDEFWIFDADGSFRNEDSGNITTTGTYTVDGNVLTIMSRQPGSEGEEENFTGTFSIEGRYMDYTFTEIGDDDYTTYRFLKQ